MGRKLLLGSTLGGTAALGFAGGASSGVLLSLGTTAFEFTKIKMRTSLEAAWRGGANELVVRRARVLDRVSREWLSCEGRMLTACAE